MDFELTQLTEKEEFSFEVYASSRMTELSGWGWTGEQQLQFLEMQHRAQQQCYRQQYPTLQYNIIWNRGKRTGRLATAQLAEELVLVDIILLPEFQNKGLGSYVLQYLQDEATMKNMPLRLCVLTDSPATKLYERVGFKMIDCRGPYSTMKWFPTGQ